MRHNKKIQALADAEAQKEGYLCASYAGRFDETFVYYPRYTDSYPRCTGLPELILVEGDKAWSVCGFESFEIMDRYRDRDYAKGRAILREYVRKFKEAEFANDEERHYITEIVITTPEFSFYHCPIELQTMYDYLEIADRLNMKVTIEPIPETMDRCDGWEYYIQLV